jgi:membrane protein DedA with SNARE-associated domain
MFLESALIPIPSEVTMPFSGFLASTGVLNFWLIVITGTLANLAGSITAYYVGYLLEETVLLKLIKKYGKFILISETEYRHAEHWFQKYGDKVIFISRLLPGVRTVISLPAGMFEMNLKKFIIYTTLGCFIWSALLTYIGMYMGENWQALEPYYRKFEIVVVIGIILAVLWYVDHKLHLRKKLLKK